MSFPKGYITVAQAAEKTGASAVKIYEAIKNRWVRSVEYKFGQVRFVVNEEDVVDFFKPKYNEKVEY